MSGKGTKAQRKKAAKARRAARLEAKKNASDTFQRHAKNENKSETEEDYRGPQEEITGEADESADGTLCKPLHSRPNPVSLTSPLSASHIAIEEIISAIIENIDS